MLIPDARRLARALMTEHGLTEWQLSFDRAKTRAGVCRFGRKEIGLSLPMTLLHSEQEVRETILHEIAHALVGPRHGHDAVWRRTALQIGSTGERCVPKSSPRPPGDWVGTCPAGHHIQLHRAPRRVRSCVRCSREFSVAHLFTWTHKGAPARLPDAYRAELATLSSHPPRRSVGAAAGAGERLPRIGDLVRITAAGRYQGAVGTVEGYGRKRYQVRLAEGLLLVPVTYLVAA